MSLLPQRFLHLLEHSARLSQGKGWGVETVDQEVQAALRLHGRPNTVPIVVADIGANRGNWTAALLQQAPDAKVWAFEPSSVAFDALRRRFEHDGRVTPVNSAIGDRTGTAELWTPSPGSVVASLEKRRVEHFGYSFDQSEQVQISTLDDWFSNHEPRPTLLKMDIEGFELSALSGASELIKSVRAVQFEFGPPNIDTRTFLQDYWYFFQDHGFELWRLGPRGPRRLDEYFQGDEVFLTTNLYARRTGVSPA